MYAVVMKLINFLCVETKYGRVCSSTIASRNPGYDPLMTNSPSSISEFSGHDGDSHHGDLAILAKLGVARNYKKNSEIVGQDADLKGVWLVTTGVAKGVSYTQEGQEVWLCEYRQGALLGLPCLLTGQPSDQTILAETDLQVSWIDIPKLAAVLSENVEIRRAVTWQLSHDLVLARKRYFDAASLSVAARICAELLYMSDEYQEKGEARIIRPAPVFSKLAARLNTSRETVSRQVARLDKLGVVHKEPGALIIMQPDTLADWSHDA